MKRYLTPLLFILGIQISTAQIDTNKKTVDTTKKAIQLSTEIKVVPDAKPQFKTESITESSKAKKSAGSMKPQASMLSSGGIDAGRTAATLDVSASGGATFSVPITLPPGLGNTVPQLALAYNSQGGLGTAGYGWNISGLSAISRIPSTTFHDGQISGVDFNEHDRFALDGQRLILKSGTYGGDGAEYQTENYSNTRIISRGVSPYGASYGPQSFEVYFPDGSKAYYGFTTNSRTQSDYALTYTESPIGARINYTYLLNGNTLNISQISYGTLGTTPGINQINFSYVASSRTEKFYVGGLLFYKSNILNKISVVANGANFRHYVLSYNTMPLLNYERLAVIQELDGAEINGFDPIYFTYGSTGDVITSHTISNLSVQGIASNNAEVVTADFTGNGSMDFLLYPNTKDKFWAFYDLDPGSPYMQLGYQVNSGFFKEIFPATWLTHNNKILAGQGMIVIKDGPNGSYKFEMLSSGTVAPVYYQYDRVWTDVPLTPTYWAECESQMWGGEPAKVDFISGDFNGDGLTDLIGVNQYHAITGRYRGADPVDPWSCGDVYGNMPSSVYFINMDRRLTSNFVTNLGALSEGYSGNYGGATLFAADFNGDGKTDIMHMTHNKMSVYTMNNNNALELLWQTSDSRIVHNLAVLLGDYNADGKTDVMFATGYSSLFATFMSTGKSFEKYEQYQPFSHTAGTWDGTPGVERLDLYNLVPNDVDGDGKTDIISTHTITTNISNYGTANITVYHNIAAPGAFTSFVAGTPGSQYTNLKHYPIPVFLNPDRPNHKLEFGFMSDNSVSLFKFSKDFRTESQVNGISQDGIYHQVEYSELMPDQNIGNSVPVYQTSYDQTYPYVDLQGTPTMSVVNKLTRYFGSEQVSQVFGYGKAVSHAEGLGFLGFSESIRSNWHIDESDENRMFNIRINSPGLRGAPLKTFTTKSPYISNIIRDTPAILPDTTLSGIVSTAQTIVASSSITLLPGFEASGSNGDFIAKINDPAQGVNDNGTLSDYITRTDYTYNTQLFPNKAFTNISTSVATKDLLNQTNTLQVMEYDIYYNATKTISNFGGSGSKTVEVTYGNNSGSGYYIGRPLTTKTTMNNGSDSFTTSEEYTYTGYLATQIKKKGNNTPFTTENIVYDAYGNVTQRTIIVPGGGQRTVSMTYDPTGRFMTQNIDLNGKTSSFVYDASTGSMQSRTNPFSQTDIFLYDTWGRQIRMTDFLNVKNVRSYEKDGYNILITDSDDEGRSSIQVINPLGQTIESRRKTIFGQFISQAMKFDVYNRLIEESQPGQPGSYNQWNQTGYDEYGRVKQTVAFTGKTTNLSYSGLNTTVNNGTKSVITTKNQLGQISMLQDPGGTINYSYFANGILKNANYGGISQSIEQDGWGRKTKLADPSSGVYQFEYDGWGQVTKEVTPKGTTEYTYDAVGKLLEKKITGDDTNMQYNYIYNSATTLLSAMNLTNTDGNNINYTYTYDTDKRLISRTENNLHAQFTNGYTYDGYGRVSTESYEAKNKLNNIVVQKTVERYYQNGELLQTTLQGSGQVLSKVNSIDAIGRLSTTLQGSALKTTFHYDTYGLPQQGSLDRISGTAANLMDLGYNFDGQRGLLNSRSNSAFNWSESFSYDNLDRLTNFNDNNGNNSQAYDSHGRITSNALGNYSYQSNTYKQSELELSTAGDAYYQARALQQVTYNAFDSPIEIIEQGHDRISFQYNAVLGRSHMYFGSEEADKMQRRFRRHYAEDGSMEITNDFQNGTTSFTFYLGGDGYTAPAIWKEVHSSSVAQNLYYLHRDHLGSIVMITDDQGNVVEKRQFDAWGNIVKLTDGSGNPLTTFLMTDRGYTSHEHLLGVRLIHMNGRLYDPNLHRFLSPDNFIQDPYNTQNYNYFGYVLNNPLSLNDPSGEFIFSALIPGLGIFIDAALWGAVLGGAGYTASVALSPGGFKNWNSGQFWKSVGIGAVSGVATAGIGQAFGAVGSGGFGGEVLRAFGHGLSNGIISGVAGGNFESGFLSGALGSLAGSGFQSVFGNGAVGTYAFSGLAGGVGAELSGGDFWQGAAIGLMNAGLNHLQQGVQNKFFDSQLKKMYKIYEQSVKDSGEPADFYSSIGGPLGKWAAESPQDFGNTCAARLSKALNYGGFEIPKGTPATYLGGDGKSYFIHAKAMSKYLSGSKMWGTPRSVNPANLRNAVYFQTGFEGGVSGHLDIMYRGKYAHDLYPGKPTIYWH
jgi:RHS repeat-associated protein